MIKFLLESYENLLTLSTVDKNAGKVQITIAPDYLADCQVILADMGKRFPMIQIFDDETKSQANY